MPMTLAGTGGAVLGTNGYAYLPNGLIAQWGQVAWNTSTETTKAVSFSVTFPTATLHVNGILQTSGGLVLQLNSFTASSATFGRGVPSGASGLATTFYWYAIGY